MPWGRSRPRDLVTMATDLDEPDGAGLRVQDLSKRFGAVHALREVSFQTAAGEFVTLLGPSGCGKTTLLRIVAGLELADAGHVSLGGRSLAGLPANRRPVNTVFQNYALFPHLDVFENVAFGLRSRRVRQDQVRQRVHAALDLLRIAELAGRHPHELSGGQKQRVALARALVNEPTVLLLDEPMSALDAKLRAEVQMELRRLQQRLGRTFLLVTHDQDEAMVVSDRVLVMRDGRIEQEGSPAEVYERPRNRFVAEFLGAANLLPARCDDGAAITPWGRLTVSAPPPWRTGMLAIRPERIRLGSVPPAHNGLAARVRQVVYRGAHLEVLLEPGDLRAQAPVGMDLRPGDAAWLELPAQHLHALEGEPEVAPSAAAPMVSGDRRDPAAAWQAVAERASCPR